MPLEYTFTGVSMNFSRPANSTISSTLLAISRRPRPRMEALRKMFSRPESWGWKPAPSSSSAEMRPLLTTRPLVGL